MSVNIGSLEFELIAKNGQINDALDETGRRIQGLSDLSVKSGASMEESFKKAATQEMAEDEAALMVLHPGYVDKYIYDTSYITKNRALEVDFAINPEVPKWCAENGVQLLTYADL